MAIFKCLLFGEARSLVGGVDCVRVDCSTPTATAAEFLSLVVQAYPQLQKIATMLVLTVNCEYVPINGCNGDGSPVIITDLDEVALMPPISGG